MKFLMVVPYYLTWHYSTGLREWARNLFTFLAFEFHFFSVKDLLLTLFSPFQRLKERYSGSPIDIEAMLSVLTVNVIMRAVGFVVRSVLLVAATVTISISFALVIGLLALWLVLPFAILGGTVFGAWSFLTYKP